MLKLLMKKKGYFNKNSEEKKKSFRTKIVLLSFDLSLLCPHPPQIDKVKCVKCGRIGLQSRRGAEETEKSNERVRVE